VLAKPRQYGTSHTSPIHDLKRALQEIDDLLLQMGSRMGFEPFAVRGGLEEWLDKTKILRSKGEGVRIDDIKDERAAKDLVIILSKWNEEPEKVPDDLVKLMKEWATRGKISFELEDDDDEQRIS
jgi:hypothetical protein